MQIFSLCLFKLPTVKRLLSVDPLLAHCQEEDGYTLLHHVAYGGHAATASTAASGHQS